MHKNVKKIIAMGIVATAISTISSFGTTKAYAAHRVRDGELSELEVSSADGDELELKDDYYGEEIDFEHDDNQYYVRQTDDSEGIEIDAEVEGDDRIIRIFLSDEPDAQAYKVGDTLPLVKGDNNIYIRTYESLNDFRHAKDRDDDVRDCEEEYIVHVRKTESSKYDDDSQAKVYLSSLSLNREDIDFSRGRTKYDVKVSSSVDDIKITAKPQDEDDRVRINGSLVDDDDNYRKTVSLEKGMNQIEVKVTDDKDNQRIYTLNIRRGSSSYTANDDIFLEDLELSEGDIDFDREKTSYLLHVDNDVRSIKIKAEPEQYDYLVTINDEHVYENDDYETKVYLDEGRNKIKVVVEDEINDEKRTYDLSINRDEKDEKRDDSSDDDSSYENAKAETVTNTKKKTSGWLKIDGNWTYNDTNGERLKNKWLKANNNWYLFNNDGNMVTGWQYAGGKWYYFKADGTMKTDWLKEESVQVVNGERKTVTNWYYLKPDGSMHTGWLNAGKWFYFNRSGVMQTGWVIDNGSKYYFNSDGSMQSEDKVIDGKTYKFSSSGAVIL